MPSLDVNDRLLSRAALHGIAAALTIPIILFPLPEYDFNLTMALLPLAALAMIRQHYDQEAMWLATSALAGLMACLIGAWLWPGGLARSLLSLMLLLMAPVYFFLGRELAATLNPVSIFRSLASFSALFGIAVAGRLLLLGEPLRIYPNGRSTLNATFFGLPIFGTFGVLSLVYVFCIQAFLCCGAILAAGNHWALRAFSAVGLAALLFLIAASDARSAQAAGLILVAGVGVYAIARTPAPRSVAQVGLSVVAALAAGYPFLSGSRLVDTFTVAGTIDGAPSSVVARYGVTNGRYEAIELALTEIARSPIIGVGFGTYGRVSREPVPRRIALNKSPHIYYLKVLWKGGLLFALPFLFFLLRAASPLWSNWPPQSPEIAFAAGAVVTTLLWLNLWWDILNVPSAGALAFFLLGALAGRSTKSEDKSVVGRPVSQKWRKAA